MSLAINEYQLLDVIKLHFDYIKNNDTAFMNTFEALFDSYHVSDKDRNAFKDMIKNDKIAYKASFTNVASELATIVCMMDQEVQRDNPIGDYIGESENGSKYGYFMTGVYSFYVYSTQLLLTRLLSLFLRFIIESYINSNSDNIFTESNINTDRFGPSTDYLPPNTYLFHLILRCTYLEDYEKIYSEITQIQTTIWDEGDNVECVVIVP